MENRIQLINKESIKQAVRTLDLLNIIQNNPDEDVLDKIGQYLDCFVYKTIASSIYSYHGYIRGGEDCIKINFEWCNIDQAEDYHNLDSFINDVIKYCNFDLTKYKFAFTSFNVYVVPLDFQMDNKLLDIPTDKSLETLKSISNTHNNENLKNALNKALKENIELFIRKINSIEINKTEKPLSNLAIRTLFKSDLFNKFEGIEVEIIDDRDNITYDISNRKEILSQLIQFDMVEDPTEFINI